MSLITRTYTFSDGTTAYGSQVDTEIAGIVNTLNSLDQGNTTWTNVRVTTLTPLDDINMGSNQLTNLAAPSTSGNAAVYPITTSQIQDEAVTTDKLADGSVTADKLDSGVIDTDQIVANAVTQVQRSNSSVGYTQAGSTSITTVSITTTGGPVLLLADATIAASDAAGTGHLVRLLLFRDAGSDLTSVQIESPNETGPTYGQSLVYVDNPAAGTYTYRLHYRLTNLTISSVVEYHLSAVELKR